ncbi:acyl-CoA-binding protein [Theileria orientalis]|uniref:Acyl-CoA-binding protein n=1 Tax=Theileria orientalis TaxID=68886 RepID=A0A976XJ41_THEOR|nr:acyl-CoA-binding protein [Theileria orientalis]
MSDDSFDEAVKFISETTCMKASDEQKLTFYKYYKQATVGDCNTPKPSMFDFKNKAKWESWNSMRGTSKEEARRAYVDFLNKIQPNWKNMNKCG